MSVDYKGIIKGNHSAIDIAKAIATYYGGDHFKIRFGSESLIDFGLGLGRGIDGGHFVLDFDEEFSEEVKALRPWERGKHRVHRMMHIHTDGSCACDYAEITTEPMTYVSLGHWGECKEIIDALVAHFGGYINDEEGSQEWERMTDEAHDAAANRIGTRMAEIALREAEHAARVAEKAS
jgi:hypothetical protein